MPFFTKKLTKDQQLKLDTKLRIAEDRPDVYFDLSECSISKIPEGVFSKIKVLQKQALLLQHNLLEDFKGGGNITDLSHLVILDISHNKFTQLPKSIGQLSNLQKLAVAHNKLKRLPEEIGYLKQLQVFDLSDNQIASLPSSMKSLTSLESLNVTNNVYFTQLNPSLCHMTHLKEFKFDQERITYPAKEITSKGIVEIQRWFRKLVGEELFVEECDGPAASTQEKYINRLPSEDTEFEDAIIARERQRHEQNLERMRLEQGIMEMQEDNARYLANAQHERENVLKEIEKADIEAEEAIVKRFETETTERNKMLEELYLKNDHLDDTVNFVLQMTERARHTEELMEELEEEQLRTDKLVKITVDESERLRKQEIVDAMNMIMKENEQSRRMWRKYESQRDADMKKSLLIEEEDTEGLEQVLHDTEVTQHALMQQLMTEEKKQREAFEALQFQKDVKLNRLNNQVALVEAQLAQLSLLEIQKRHEKQEQQINTLAEMRIQTALLLSKLIDEQEKRENRLKDMVARMEKEREDDAKDYWLIQFQRLLDSKPQILIDAENRLDAFVVDTVLQAGCKEYLAHFARHNIDETAMLEMTTEKLDQIGVKDKTAQENIMASLKSVLLMNDHLMKRQNSYTASSVNLRGAEAVELEPYHFDGRPLKDLCQESECVVCMDNRPEVVFLPCGHVCTCTKCCPPLKDCPICRQEIKQTFRLYGGC